MYGIGLMSITWVVTWNGGYREVPCNQICGSKVLVFLSQVDGSKFEVKPIAPNSCRRFPRSPALLLKST